MKSEYIYSNDLVYSFLVQQYIEDLSDPIFREDKKVEIAIDERRAQADYIESLLSYDKQKDHAIEMIKDMVRHNE